VIGFDKTPKGKNPLELKNRRSPTPKKNIIVIPPSLDTKYGSIQGIKKLSIKKKNPV